MQLLFQQKISWIVDLFNMRLLHFPLSNTSSI